jgi:polyisoprenoid-binding protein YceI
VTVAEPVGTSVDQYKFDKSVSRFTVRATASGMLSVMGHNPTIAIRDFTGEAGFDAAAPEKATLRIEIRADSFEVTDDIKASDRREIESTMNQKVLETSKFPTILFEGAQAKAETLGEGRYRITMNGSLSLHGVTRNLPVMAQVSVTGAMLKAYGEFSIQQSDFDIAPVSVAGGALKLKDELKFAFDIVARKQV